jgi:lipopolysaccharide export system protein LptA
MEPKEAMPLTIKVRFLFLLLFFSAGLSHALPTDKEQIMHVTADSADLSQQKHKGTYIGNVVFIQGSTNLQAEKAITEGNIKNQLTLAIANGSEGKQAHYWTETGPNKPPFHAYADTIKYFPLKHTIELIGHARVEQGPNSLSAAKIIYDTLEQHVVSQSDGKTRTVIILYPEKKAT